MRAEVLEGLRDRTNAFVKKFSAVEDQSVDIYVYHPLTHRIMTC